MKVYQIPVGPMQNFSYIVEDESTHEAIVIDPSWDLEKLTEIINDQNINPSYLWYIVIGFHDFITTSDHFTCN